MPWLSSANAMLLPMAVLAAVIVCVAIFVFQRLRKRAERELLSAFGKAPEHERKDVSSVRLYHTLYRENRPCGRFVDDITWNDLNMDDVFWRVNACASFAGEEYLYHILHDLKPDAAALEKRERLYALMEEYPLKRLRLQKKLRGIGKRKNNGLGAYLFDARSKKLRYAWVYPLLGALPLCGAALLPFAREIGLFFLLCAAGVNLGVYFFKRSSLETELSAMQSVSALLYGARGVESELGETLLALGFDVKSALRPFKKLGGLLPEGARRGVSELEALIVLLKAAFLIDFILFNRTVRILCRHTKELNLLFEAVGEVDAAVSVASFRRSLPRFCLPRFGEETALRFEEAYHPLLKDPVANSASITRTSIVTGSNASGKSTFIKALAVNAILAQTIHTCCAREYALYFCYVATSMALKDDVLHGESYFVAEINSLKRILGYCAQKKCACFIDEILRGTNTPERIAASTAVLRHLSRSGSLCVAASHDIELTELLVDACDNYHFSESLLGGAVHFDYLLKDGPSRSTNAIKLLRHMGFDEEVVEEAARLAGFRAPPEPAYFIEKK